MRDYKPDRIPVPEDHAVAHIVLGFDKDGDLFVVQCDANWEPYEYYDLTGLFQGPVKRFVYYVKKRKEEPEVVTYFTVHEDNTVSVCETLPPEQVVEAENLSPDSFLANALTKAQKSPFDR